jgi:hypothetical protein
VYLDWNVYYLELEVTFGKLDSFVSIDDFGSIEASFTKTDVETLRDTFTNSEGESVMSLEIRAGVVGSAISGPSALLALESVSFAITFVSTAKVETCASANLAKDSVTAYDNEQRDNVLEYQIYTQSEVEANGGAQRELKVKALKIQNNKEADCALHQYAQFYNPYTLMWEDLRDNDYVTMHMEDHYFSLAISQKLYIDTLGWMFAFDEDLLLEELPAFVYINVRFITYNPANDQQWFEDKIEIMITPT